MGDEKCKIEGCERKYHCKNMCRKHYDSTWHKENREQYKDELNLKRKQIYYANRERELAVDKEYAIKNRPAKLVYYKEYYIKNREKRIAQACINSANRRAKKISTAGSWVLTKEWRDGLFATYENRCVYCGIDGKLARYGHLTLDHKTPLARGGLHRPENIVPACPSCNDNKQDKTVEEYGVPLRSPVPVFRLALELLEEGL